MSLKRIAATVFLLASTAAFLASVGVVLESRAYAVFCPGPNCQAGCHYMSADVRRSNTTCVVIEAFGFAPAQAIWGDAPRARISNKQPKVIPGQFVARQNCTEGTINCSGVGPMEATTVWNCTQPGNQEKRICPIK